ncbi:hypothetical protein V8G54_036076 [Vigna mungo]|uniref:Uncharacterized protein n=1 Tax=Vigna mungo TaxID=3915 RepID=A0AAQ3MG94_VIGMU
MSPLRRARPARRNQSKPKTQSLPKTEIGTSYSPLRSVPCAGKSLRLRGSPEKEERSLKFSLTLMKKEIEEDFMNLRRRPFSLVSGCQRGSIEVGERHLDWMRRMHMRLKGGFGWNWWCFQELVERVETEVPMNSDRNYNGPKVAKFLVGLLAPGQEDPMKASLFPGIDFGLFLRSLGRGQRRPSSLWEGGGKAIRPMSRGTISGRQLLWGVGLPKCNGGVQSAKAEGSLTARPTRRAGTKVGLSDPTVPSGRITNLPQSSHRREGLTPRCYSMFQGLDCSSIKAVRELGSKRCETVQSIVTGSYL